ncbi:MAG TPA: glycosyl hydrolase family 28 protein [Paludibacter sp.]|nr:glycosyl hydrolase family 28 protein [Paludibacter sp.]
MLKRFLILVLLFSVVHLRAQRLDVFPSTEYIPHNNDFTVKVRIPGQEWKDLYEYEALVDMHNVRKSSMVYFDFQGKVEVSVTSNKGKIQSARIRPLSYQVQPVIGGNTLTFSIDKPCNLSVEINGDMFHNLHVFTNAPETYKPDPNDTNVIYLKPGYHTFPNNRLDIPSGKTLYLAGGAVLKSSIKCENVKNVRICGRGIVYKPDDGVGVDFSDSVVVEDLVFLNPNHYTVLSGQSNNVTIKNIRSFSSKGWGDGIDLFCNQNALIDGVFMRNSDDCVAVYNHRWKYYGNSRNIRVRNSTLWADVAHTINIGGHGNSDNWETIEDMTFKNIDILNQDEPQLSYRGCIAMGVADGNMLRNIRFEDIRIEELERGQLFSFRVEFNRKYAKSPGRGIEDIYLKDITYNGTRATTSIIEGYNENRMVRNIIFENLVINGVVISDDMKKPGYMPASDFANVYVGPHVEGLKFITAQNVITQNK